MKDSTEYLEILASADPNSSEHLFTSMSPIGFNLAVPVYDENNVHIDYRYYYLDMREEIGNGQYGTVYMGYPIDDEGQVIRDKPVAIKVLSEFNENEYDIFSRYYHAEKPVILDENVYLIMEYFPGHDLFNADHELNTPFQNLNLGTTFELIYQLCLAINLLHHETPRSGRAVLHCDIKGTNIRVNEKNGKVDVYLIDFGFSDEIEDNPHLILDNLGRGTPLYAPLETGTESRRGIKSDIFGLTPIILILLGAKDPFSLRVNALNDAEMYQTKFDFNGLFRCQRFKKDLKLLPFQIHSLITSFLERMQDDYDARPDSDELLRFFTSLNLIFKLTTHKKRLAAGLTLASDGLVQSQIIALNDSIQEHYCTMILLAESLWNVSVSNIIGDINLQKQIIHAYHVGMDSSREGLNAAIKKAKKEFSERALDDLKDTFDPHLLTQLKFLIGLHYDLDPQISNLKAKKPAESRKINILMKHCAKYNIELSFQLLNLFKPEKINLLAGIKYCVEVFIERKKKEPQRLSLSFWSYNKSDILAAADKLILILAGDDKSLSSREQNILNSTDLAGLIKDTNLYEMISKSKIAPLRIELK